MLLVRCERHLTSAWLLSDAAVEMDDYYDELYCPACDKSFKSDKAWVIIYTPAVKIHDALKEKIYLNPLTFIITSNSTM